MRRGLVWFTEDLRLDDNETLPERDAAPPMCEFLHVAHFEETQSARIHARQQH